MKIWKIGCLAISLLLIFAGCLGYSYSGFQIKLGKKISSEELSSAENILNAWEKTITFGLLKNIAYFKKEFAFQKGWLLSQRGDYAGAIKEFRLSCLYNATTLSLADSLSGKGREGLEKLAGDYIKVLTVNPNDFQAKINLEIIRILQKQAKEQNVPASGQDKGEGKKKIKVIRPGDKDGRGLSSPEDQEQRY